MHLWPAGRGFYKHSYWSINRRLIYLKFVCNNKAHKLTEREPVHIGCDGVHNMWVLIWRWFGQTVRQTDLQTSCSSLVKPGWYWTQGTAETQTCHFYSFVISKIVKMIITTILKMTNWIMENSSNQNVSQHAVINEASWCNMWRFPGFKSYSAGPCFLIQTPAKITLT